MDFKRLDVDDFWNGTLSLEEANEAEKRWVAYPELIEFLEAIVGGHYGKITALSAIDKAKELLTSLNEVKLISVYHLNFPNV